MEILHDTDPRDLEEYMQEILLEADRKMNETEVEEDGFVGELDEMGEDRRNLGMNGSYGNIFGGYNSGRIAFNQLDAQMERLEKI